MTQRTADDDAVAVRPHGLRQVAIALCLLLVTTGLALGFRTWPFNRSNAQVPLQFMGVSVAPDGTISGIPPGSSLVYLPGSRVAVQDLNAATPEEKAAAQRDRDWLTAGTIPGAGDEFEDMSVNALLDIHALTLGNGAIVAGWSPKWRYVWPRDTAFVSWSLAATGHTEDAVRALEFLQSVQSPDGSFEARYLPDGSGPPDDRGIQTDGTGWALWATAKVLGEINDPIERTAVATRLTQLIDRSTAHILSLTEDGTRLPPASPDYWEVETKRLTLGTCAPLAIALNEAPEALRALGKEAEAVRVADAATSFDALVRTAFAPEFGRFRGASPADTAIAFLLPPFAEAQPEVTKVWRDAASTMARPAGGLAPGASWKQDGISWTPTTTVFAMTAAGLNEDELARSWLRWVDDHRTVLGAIPEKVLYDGTPAALAPLTWSSANVLLTLTILDGSDAPAGYLP